jgi:hypothetical protein
MKRNPVPKNIEGGWMSWDEMEPVYIPSFVLQNRLNFIVRTRTTSKAKSTVMPGAFCSSPVTFLNNHPAQT